MDPKVADLVSKELSKDSIVIFDEAHNIDNVCIEALSVDISRPTLDSAARACKSLERQVNTIRETEGSRLQGEYQRLVEGLRETSERRVNDEFMANPALPDDLLKEAVPGNIRRAEHFVAFLRRFVEYLKVIRF